MAEIESKYSQYLCRINVKGDATAGFLTSGIKDSDHAIYLLQSEESRANAAEAQRDELKSTNTELVSKVTSLESERLEFIRKVRILTNEIKGVQELGAPEILADPIRRARALNSKACAQHDGEKLIAELQANMKSETAWAAQYKAERDAALARAEQAERELVMLSHDLLGYIPAIHAELAALQASAPAPKLNYDVPTIMDFIKQHHESLHNIVLGAIKFGRKYEANRVPAAPGWKQGDTAYYYNPDYQDVVSFEVEDITLFGKGTPFELKHTECFKTPIAAHLARAEELAREADAHRAKAEELNAALAGKGGDK